MREAALVEAVVADALVVAGEALLPLVTSEASVAEAVACRAMVVEAMDLQAVAMEAGSVVPHLPTAATAVEDMVEAEAEVMAIRLALRPHLGGRLSTRATASSDGSARLLYWFL